VKSVLHVHTNAFEYFTYFQNKSVRTFDI